MKKRILSLIFAILLLIPCLTLTASADTCDISLWDDLKTLRHNGALYTRFDASMTEWEYDCSYNGVTYDIAEVKYVDYNLSVNDVIIEADIYLKDGTSIHASFINENYLEEHNSICNNPAFYEIEFEYANTHTVAVSSQHFNGNKTTVDVDEIRFSEYFSVNTPCADDSFYVKKGILALIDDEYYYVSYTENNCNTTIDLWHVKEQVLTAHKITDTETINRLNTVYDEYDFDSLSIFESDLTGGFGIVLLCIAFGLIPLAALIIFLMLSIRAKVPAYKKMFRAIWVTSAAELFVFAVTVILIVMFS